MVRQMFKRITSVFLLLGTTSGIGAITHGNDPYYSFLLAGVAFVVLLMLNLPDIE